MQKRFSSLPNNGRTRDGSQLVWGVVWGAGWVVVGEVVWEIQANCFLHRFLRQNIQDDDSMFELNGLEILTQKQKQKKTIAECLLISSLGPLSF